MEFMDLMKEWLWLREIERARTLGWPPSLEARMKEIEEEINRRMRGEP